EGDAERMLERLAGRTHLVVSGLCLLTPGWEHVEPEVTRVTFRPLTPRDLAAYLTTREWEGRAGAYAIQGVGASLVEQVEGDYLNVVGLPAALLVRLLAERFGGSYGFGCSAATSASRLSCSSRQAGQPARWARRPGTPASASAPATSSST